VWRDRDGLETGVLGEPDLYNEVRLSPDGKRALVTVTDPVRGTDDIWIFDIARNLRTKFTFDPGFEMSIAPTPDGKALMFTRGTQSSYAIHRKAIGGAGEGEVLLETEIDAYPSSVSPDGQHLVFFRGGEQSNWDLWILPLSGATEPFALIETDFAEREGTFSPDGRWLAYQSDESGRAEIYVVPFPGMERKWQISTHGGSWAGWSPDGREIIYLAPDGTLTAVEVEVQDGGLVPGAAQALFSAGRPSEGNAIWAQSPDGDRFLVLEPASGGEIPAITVAVNALSGSRGS
jgi:Tol biopolymer transport system component